MSLKNRSLGRQEVEATGKPFYTKYANVPEHLYSKTQCKRLKLPVIDEEEPDAYVLNRFWKGYLPLYGREVQLLDEEEAVDYLIKIGIKVPIKGRYRHGHDHTKLIAIIGKPDFQYTRYGGLYWKKERLEMLRK